MAHQTLHSAQALRAREESEAIEHPAAGLERAVPRDERDHASEARGLAPRQRVLRMALETGIEHAPHPRVGGEAARQLEGVLLVTLHPYRQGLGPAQGEPAVEGTRD